MDKTKIQLSVKEMELVTNKDMILTKNAIIKKVISLLENIQDKEKKIFKKLASGFPAETTNTPPKISRGENYHGLPYLVLDYPRVFDKENVFAIRIMFWWGNFFSITLHLSGKYKLFFENRLIKAFENLKKDKFYTCVNKKEWEHHFEESNYKLLSQISKVEFKNSITHLSFVKLAKKFPLQNWNDIPGTLMTEFKRMTKMLN